MGDIFINKLKTNAYNNLSIENHTPDLNGWIDRDFNSTFVSFLKPDTNIVIEVGTWKGCSTIRMADCMKAAGIQSPTIIAVDTWLGAPEFWTWGIDDPTRGISLNCQNGYPSVFYTFTKNVKSYGYDNIIAPFPISSIQGADVLKYYKITADIIYVDAAHEYEPVKADIKHYWNILKQGGVMFGDDYADYWPGVKQAVNEFVYENNLKLSVNGVVWSMTKP